MVPRARRGKSRHLCSGHLYLVPLAVLLAHQRPAPVTLKHGQCCKCSIPGSAKLAISCSHRRRPGPRPRHTARWRAACRCRRTAAAAPRRTAPAPTAAPRSPAHQSEVSIEYSDQSESSITLSTTLCSLVSDRRPQPVT